MCFAECTVLYVLVLNAALNLDATVVGRRSMYCAVVGHTSQSRSLTAHAQVASTSVTLKYYHSSACCESSQLLREFGPLLQQSDAPLLTINAHVKKLSICVHDYCSESNTTDASRRSKVVIASKITGGGNIR
jgi:hypothetical protein